MVRFIALLIAACFLAGPSAGAASPDLDAVVAPLAQPFVAKHGGRLSIGITRRGQPAMLVYGVGEKADANAEIGSLGKTMLGVILANAIVEGRVALEDDVREHLEGDYPNLAQDGEPVRLVHLANMTSGLPDNVPDLSGTPTPADKIAALRAYSNARFLVDLHAAKLTAKPGGDPAHSNAAAQLLSIVLERVYGQPYEALLARYVEKPLGMAASGSGTLLPGHDSAGVAVARLDTPFPRAAGGLSYTTADMLKYAAYHLAEPDPAVRPSHQGTWFTLDRRLSVGFFWIIGQDDQGGRRLRYSGGTYGFSSFCDLYPEAGLGLGLVSDVADHSAQAEQKALSSRS